MDAEERLARLQALVEAEPVPQGVVGTARPLSQVCRVAARSLKMSGATISVMTNEGPSAIVAAVDESSADITELQFTLGEGPGWDAFESRSPVMAGDLHHDERWPGYRSSMSERGIRASFAFPLVVGPARLGVLDVFRDAPGLLMGAYIGRALDFATLATAFLLDRQEDAGDGQTPPLLHGALESRLPIYQAQGMLSVQLGLTLPEALARLRAHAYTHDRTLSDVARDVVSRTLSMERDNQ